MKRHIILGLAFATLLTGCKDEWEDMNTDPTNPTEVPVEFVFTNVARQGLGEQEYINTRGNLVFGATYAHYLRIGFAPRSFKESQGYTDATWDQNFGQYSRNVNDVIARTSPDGDSPGVLRNACARILKAAIVQRTTDMFGDIPYSEAGKGSFNSQPKYDTQEEIYAGLLDELKAASETIGDQTENVWGGADPVYDGYIQNWKKFANSLRLRLAVRSYDAFAKAGKTEFVKNHITDALAAGVFESNGDNATLKNFSGTTPDIRAPWHESSRANGPFMAENSIITYLQDTDDPRLFVWFSKATMDDDAKALFNNDTYDKVIADLDKKIAGSEGAEKEKWVEFKADFENAGAANYPTLNADEVFPAIGKEAYRGRPMGYDYNQTGFDFVPFRAFIEKGKFLEYNYTYSYLGKTVIAEDVNTFFMTYSEVCFLKSEIALNGWASVNGSASQLYQQGIEANMEQWAQEELKLGKADQPAEGLLTVNMGNYTAPAFSRENLYFQRWSSYMGGNCYEAYSFIRRVGQDFLKPYIPNRKEENESGRGIIFELDSRGNVIPGCKDDNYWPFDLGFTEGEIPGRLKYGIQEKSLNSAHYQEASSRIGGDEISTKVWWAKK